MCNVILAKEYKMYYKRKIKTGYHNNCAILDNFKFYYKFNLTIKE